MKSSLKAEFFDLVFPGRQRTEGKNISSFKFIKLYFSCCKFSLIHVILSQAAIILNFFVRHAITARFFSTNNDVAILVGISRLVNQPISELHFDITFALTDF